MNDAPTPRQAPTAHSTPLPPSEREILVQRYVNALEHSDAAAIERVLLAAQDDAVLARQLDDIDLALAHELPQTAKVEIAATETAEVVDRKYLLRALLQEHLPKSFEPIAHEPGPLLVASVAARVEDEGPVLPADREALRQLQNDTSPLPPWLSMEAVREVAARLQRSSGAVASDKFWRRFKDAAIFAGMRATPPQAQLGLAREESKRRHSTQVEPQVLEDEASDQ